ncbi:hypothetical protein [Chryseobacterium sp.]|uniref:hypothetical protein n=1 Tax=Chryseobacterium sp. TaxID=1871047 RepID=UPI00289E97A5|nr:hypothetical protein [Chryseobacterium sp.]
MSNEIDQFAVLTARNNKNRQIKVLQWATVLSVDWEDKTCDAKGIDDGLEFYNVLIGAGCFDMKPKIGSLILIGIINNDETTPVLLSAEDIEKLEIKAGVCELTIDNGFLLKKENETLKKLMVDLLQEIQNMKFTTNTGSTINLINQPQFLSLENRFKDFLK